MGEVTIDQIWKEKDGTVALVLRQPESWDAPGVIAKLQAKINGYISVIRNGPLIERYPEYRGKKCSIRLITYYDIPEDVRRKIDLLHHHLSQQGIGFRVMQIKIETPAEARSRLKKSFASFFK